MTLPRCLYTDHDEVGFHVAFCDGSVQMIGYTIDIEIHRRLANRKDGQTIDGKKF